MDLIERFKGDKDPVENLNLGKYNELTKDCYLFLGDAYNDVFDSRYYNKKRVFLSLEEPNFCTDADTAHAKLTNGFGSTTVGGRKVQDTPPDEVLTICPYTAKCFDNRTFVFFPFNDEFIPVNTEKIYDVIYTGSHPHNVNWGGVIDVMSRYNHRYVYFTNGTHVTDIGLSYREKMNLYGQSKIAVCHGLATAWEVNVPRYRAFPKSNENEAFKSLDKNLLPQFKSRVMEAAFSKCLILHYKDEWNVIENWFDVGEEFLFFSTPEELDTIIKDVLDNPNKYQPIIDKAYNKAINNYTTKHFIEKYLGKDE